MKILFVTAEAAPLARVGGLAEVAGSLPRALIKLGHDVRVILPKHNCVDLANQTPRQILNDFEVTGLINKPKVNLLSVEINKIPFYLVENKDFFDSQVYGENELEKYYFYSKSLSEILPKLNWQPDIIHCHDWHSALLLRWRKKFSLPYRTLLTIHNMAYQGWFDGKYLHDHKLEEDWLDYPSDAPEPPFNFLSQGILYADLINTVSETYAKEILTPEFSNGLFSLIKYREKSFSGITNGIDYNDYNPDKDNYLAARFNAKTLEKRSDNKLVLQEKLGFSQSVDTPMIGMIQRLDEQKGIDILEPAIGKIMETETQLVILGQGRKYYEESLTALASRYPGKLFVNLAYNEELAHLIYGSCDIFLMPSRYEPCGLGQIIAMRYGAIPVVRHTGGLVDTVMPFNTEMTAGSGFVFYDYSTDALISAVLKALSAYKQKEDWQNAENRVMQLDFSWEKSARRYENLYREALSKNKSPDGKRS